MENRKWEWIYDGDLPMSVERVSMRQKPAERYRRYYWRILQLRIIDDDFMRKVLADKDCVQLVLQIIMEKPDLIVKEVNVQFDMKNLQGRSLELDVLAVDGMGQLYDIEVQRGDQKATPKRARYHSALIDANTSEPGEDFCRLPQNFVIFITENDVLGGGLPVYHVERTIQENGEPFGDETHILYVNAKIQDDTDLGRLMHDFMCRNPGEMNYKVLADRAKYFKETKKGVTSMCRMFEEVKEEGREECRAIFCRGLLDLLRDYGEVPDDLKKRIEGEKDMMKLSQWYRQAAHVNDIGDFMMGCE